MNIQMTTAGVRKDSRWQLLGAVGGVALALAVVAGIGVWRLNDHGGVKATVATIGQTQPVTSSIPADTLGGVAERTHIQAQLAAVPEAPAMGGIAERMTLQGERSGTLAPAIPQLDSLGGVAERIALQRQMEDQAQTSVMGGVAERIKLQEAMAAGR
jgi:hypothetical protein